MVLERIIDKISDSVRWRDKLLTRKGRDDDDISTAIELMEERVEEFRDEVNVCLQARIGRIGDDVVAIREGLSHVLARFNGNVAPPPRHQTYGLTRSRWREAACDQRRTDGG
jgi:hypothetical protein